MNKPVLKFEKQEPTFYSRIPKKALVELTPSELALYCNYKQTASEDGACWKSNATLASETQMSVSLVRRSRNSLVKKGYIQIEHRASNSVNPNETCVITIVDIWKENHEMWAGGVTDTQGGVFLTGGGGVTDTHKEEPIKKNQLNKNNFDAVGIEKAVADEPTKTNAQPSLPTTLYPFPTNMNTGRINVSSIEESLSLDNSERETTKKDGLTLCLDNELHKCTGTKGLKESDIKKLSKQIEFMYNDVMYKQSPMSMYEKHGDKYLKWIKTVFFPYWKNKMSHTDTGVKLSTSKALELLSGQKSFIDFMDWLKANAPKKTIKIKWTWDRDCEICGGIDGYLPSGKKCSCWAEREIK